MIQQVLKIQWSCGTEFVPLGGLTGAPQIIKTTERWGKVPGVPVVSYVAKVEALSRSGKKRTLHLRYNKGDQTDPKVKDPENRGLFGVSVIKWDTSGRAASVQWIDDDDAQYNGTVKATLLGGQSPVTHLKKSVSVIVRPRQSALREALLHLDRSCVLTGEKQETALEAAHIVPVKAGGQENIENAILLRADLHRLFDAGLIWFDLSGGEVRWHSKSLSGRYTEILTGTKLPDSTFERVARALRLRKKQSGGHGRAA